MKADWTREDPAITEALAALGRSGVPVYALYAPGKSEPALLPQVLTPGIVMDAVGKLPQAACNSNWIGFIQFEVNSRPERGSSHGSIV